MPRRGVGQVNEQGYGLFDEEFGSNSLLQHVRGDARDHAPPS